MRTIFALTFGLSLFVFGFAGSAKALAADCTPVVVESGNSQSHITVVKTSTACIRYIPQPAGRASDAPLEVLLFGDPQPKSAVDADYFLRDIIQPLRGRTQAKLGLSLGDIVDDAPDYRLRIPGRVAFEICGDLLKVFQRLGRPGYPPSHRCRRALAASCGIAPSRSARSTPRRIFSMA